VFAQHLLFSRNDDIRGFPSHFVLHHWNGDTRHIASKRLEPHQQSSFQGTEETRYALDIKNVHQLISRAGSRFGPKRLIRQRRQRNLVRRVLDHSIQFRLLLAFLGRL